MTIHTIEGCRTKVQKIGAWAGVRWMRNQGVSFEHAYFVMFGRFPKVL